MCTALSIWTRFCHGILALSSSGDGDTPEYYRGVAHIFTHGLPQLKHKLSGASENVPVWSTVCGRDSHRFLHLSKPFHPRTKTYFIYKNDSL